MKRNFSKFSNFSNRNFFCSLTRNLAGIFFAGIFLSLFLSLGSLFAVPANPAPIEKKQSDGTVVTVRLRGDEKIHWTESLDSYTLMYNSNQDLVFALKDAEGDLQPSNILYKGQNLNAYSGAEKNTISSIAKNQFYSPRQVELLTQFWRMADGGTKAITQITPILGEKKVLCILANFTNKKIIKNTQEIDNLMNQVGYKTNSMGSVKDFYRANSYGKMDLTITITGPVELPESTKYYAKNGEGERLLAKTAAELADSLIDYNDFEFNGVVPTFHILFAGYGDESVGDRQQIWSHAWTFSQAIGSNLNLDGIDIVRYSCSPELAGGKGEELTDVGVICHELGHTFGSPDYYDVGMGDVYAGTGEWDLMANGVLNNNGRVPAQINMLQKILYGWVNPIELTSPSTITDMPNSVDSAMAYIVVNNSINDMYILENRQRKGFDMAVPGTGLLIYHVHPDAINKPSDYGNSGHPQKLYIVDAGRSNAFPANNAASYGNINSATATYGNAKTELTSSSTPRMFYWGGNNNSVVVNNKAITNISNEGGLISFNFMGGDSTVKIYDAALTDFVDMPAVATTVAVAATAAVVAQDTALTDIKVKLKNFGKAFTSAVVEWTVDGQNQTAFQWSGNLEYNATAVVTIGSIRIDTGEHIISAKVTIADDNVVENNAISKTVKLAVAFFKEDFEDALIGDLAGLADDATGYSTDNADDGLAGDLAGGSAWINCSDSIHKWIIGTAVANGGNKSLYITDNNKDNKYNHKSMYSQCSHIFYDIDFPDSKDSFDMFFDVRCIGEHYQSDPYDYVELRIIPASIDPVAGVLVTEGESLGKYCNIDRWTTIHKTLSSFYSDKTNRLVISWINDDFAGNQPPAAIDNIVFAARSFVPVADTQPSAVEEATGAGSAVPLHAWVMHDGSLQVSGLTVGEKWYIYSASGSLIYANRAIKSSAVVPSSLLTGTGSGLYIVKSGNRSTKFVKL